MTVGKGGFFLSWIPQKAETELIVSLELMVLRRRGVRCGSRNVWLDNKWYTNQSISGAEVKKRFAEDYMTKAVSFTCRQHTYNLEIVIPW